jgi:Transglycosylase SLT domain
MAAPSTPPPAQPPSVDPAIVRSIRQASRQSSADFGLLMAQAAQESGFHPNAKAATGSAQGLFQFIDSTWLDMMHRFGAKYGEGALAQQITLDAAGKPHVGDATARHKILGLRSDPKLSAALAGEYANLNAGEVERALGHPASRADLYMAHFLGAGGATQFLKALATKGATPAAFLLPEAAASNRAIFYDGDGRAKTVAEIYRALGGRIEAEARGFDDQAASGDSVAAALPSAALGASRRANFAGLRLTQPVAAMLDTLTLAALQLVGGGMPATANAHRETRTGA